MNSDLISDLRLTISAWPEGVKMSYMPSVTVSLSNGTVLTSGLHVIRVKRPEKLFTHVALLDLGLLPMVGRDTARAVVVELTEPTLRMSYLDDMPFRWEYLRPVRDELGAIARWPQAVRRPSYDPLLNNCEHLVSFVETGERRSPQRDWGLAVAGVAAIGCVALARRSS